MAEKTRQPSAAAQHRAMQAGGVEYLYMAAAIAVPLFTSGRAIQQDAAGALLVFFAWLGLAISYLSRTVGLPAWGPRNIGWIQLGLAAITLLMSPQLNERLPGGGFPWQMAPAAFLCWYVVLGSYFIWTDESMLFLLVPGVALFGVQSYIETAGGFEISLVLFMVSVAVVLTRLHLRSMIAAAKAAGYRDEGSLFAGPWRAMAGPVLAVVSVLVVGAASFVLAPGIGAGVRKLAGEPELKFDTPRFGSNLNQQESVRKVGQGPITSNNQVVLQLRTDAHFDYLRSHPYRFYRGTGWSEDSTYTDMEPSTAPPESSIADALVYDIPADAVPRSGPEVKAEVESISKPHEYAYSPGTPLRVEYDSGVMLFRAEFPVLKDSFPRGKKYYVRSAVANPTPEEMRAAPATDRASYATYYAAGGRDKVATAIKQLARRLAEGQPTDYDAVMAFKAEITARCRYNLKAAAIEGDRDRVEAFLFDTHEGYCDLFASSLAVLCRSVGIRARVMVGYLVRPETLTDGAYTIRDRDAHMWTEVFFEGTGWVPFDATDSAEMVPGGELGGLVDEDNGEQAPWVAYAGVGVFSSAALLLLAGAAISWRRRRNPLPPNARRLRAHYVQFIKLMRRQGIRPKAPSETIGEYAGLLDSPPAARLAGLFETALYAQNEPMAEQMDEIGGALADFGGEAANGR